MIPLLTDKPKGDNIVTLPAARQKPAPPMPIYWLWAMADTEIPTRLFPALRLFIWIALPFIFFLVGVERIFDAHGDRYQAFACFVAAFASILIVVYWDRIVLIVDAQQFEKLWPKREPVADRKRRRFLRQALKRGLDKDEILKLLGGSAKWQLQLLRFGLAGIAGF